MPAPDAVEAFYDRQKRLALGTALAVQTQWRTIDPLDIDGSWSRVRRRAVVLLAAGQLTAASDGAAYIAAAADEVGLDADRVAAVAPAAWSGVSADGRSVDGLLDGVPVDAKARILAGVPVEQALADAAVFLGGLIASELADAGRQAAATAIAVSPGIPGYVRMLRLPSCARCVVQAGKYFRWNAGFLRHPRCDCRHVPASEDMEGDLRTDPLLAARSGQVKGLSAADRKAIDNGADVGQVINAKRVGRSGMSSVQTVDVGGRSVRVTTEGTTRRGYASSVRRSIDQQRGTTTTETRQRSGARTVRRTRPRLTVDEIYRVAASRDEAVRLLHANGYVVGSIRDVAARATQTP